MIAEITLSNLKGSAMPPVSKSALHRNLICAALGRGEKIIEYRGALFEDGAATMRCLETLGAAISEEDGSYRVKPIDFSEKKSKENGGCSGDDKVPVLECGESGSTLRMLLPVAAAMKMKCKFILEGRLPERPLSPLWEELCRHGAKLEQKGKELFLDATAFEGNDFEISGSVSSQFITGLLFSLSIIEGGGKVTVTDRLESRPYVDMTIDALKDFGVNVAEKNNVFTVIPPSKDNCINDAELEIRRAEGDWSGAAFLMCAGALSKEGITCRGLRVDSIQGDRQIMEVLKKFGACVEQTEGGIKVSKKELHGIEIDASDIPDLVPTIAALAALAEGETVISGAARLRLKESDRIQATAAMVNGLGGNAMETEDGLIIKGCNIEKNPPVGGKCDSFGDHRIAMAGAVMASACSGKSQISGAEAVAKSYPAFWEDFKSLGALVTTF